MAEIYIFETVETQVKIAKQPYLDSFQQQNLSHLWFDFLNNVLIFALPLWATFKFIKKYSNVGTILRI